MRKVNNKKKEIGFKDFWLIGGKFVLLEPRKHFGRSFEALQLQDYI